MNKPNIEGYQLATNYGLLFRLVMGGYRVPCWIVEDKRFPTVWHIAEAKINNLSKELRIGYCGGGYSGFRNDQEFIECCENINLHYILPNMINKEFKANE